MILYYSCASRKYNYKLFDCYHPNHRSQLVEHKQLQESSPLLILDTVIEDEQILTKGELPSKIKINNERNVSPKIVSTLIDLFSKDKIGEGIKNILKQLKGDEIMYGDIKHLISQYLQENNCN